MTATPLFLLKKNDHKNLLSTQVRTVTKKTGNHKPCDSDQYTQFGCYTHDISDIVVYVCIYTQ